VFESRAAVLVNVERLGVSVSRADVRQDVAVLQAVEAVTSQAEVLRSSDLIERAIDSLDPAVFRARPARNPVVAMIVATITDVQGFFSDLLRELRLLPPRNERYELVKEIESNLSISPVRQAQVIRLGFAAHSPESARLVLQRLLDLYVRRAADNTLEVEGAGALLRQATAVRSELEEAERELFALRSRDGITDLAAEKASMIERIGHLTTVIEGVSDVVPMSTARAARTPPGERSVVDVPVSEAVNASVGTQVEQLRTQLNTLRVTRAGLLADLSSEHPRLRSIDRQIAIIEALLRKELSSLKDSLAGYRKRLDILTTAEPQLQRLQRNAAILSESYDVYRKAAEDRRLMREQEARLQIQIVDPPSLPYAPRGPVPILLVAGGALLGLLSGTGIAVLLAFLGGRGEKSEPTGPNGPVEPRALAEPVEPAIAEAS
jgi:uncharacterized protein involved in exopolysaccharide biosynthesis